MTTAAPAEADPSAETMASAVTPSSGAGGGTGSGTRRPWSDTEFSLLLRAWTEVDESSKRMPAARAVFDRFQLLSPDGDSGRTEHSVLVKHKMALNAYDVILAYARDVGGRSSSGDANDSAAIDEWFRLARTERRRIFATLNSKTYPYIELKPEHALTIGAMYRKHNKVPRVNALRSPATQTVAPHVAIAAKRESEHDDSEDAEDLDSDAKAFALAARQFDALLVRLRQLDARTQHSDDGDSAADRKDPELARSRGAGPVPGLCDSSNDVESSTESEEEWDEIVPRSPVYGDASDADTAPTPLKRRASASVNTVETQQPTPSSKRQCVPPELLELASHLQSQVQALKSMGDDAKAAYARAQMERQGIVRQLERDRVERQELLASVEGCYNALQAQRIACHVEHVAIGKGSDTRASATSSAAATAGWWPQRSAP